MKTEVEVPSPVIAVIMATVLLTTNISLGTPAVPTTYTVSLDRSSTSSLGVIVPELEPAATADLAGQSVFEYKQTSNSLPRNLRDRILSFKRDANAYTDDAVAISETTCQATIAFLERAMSELPGMELPKSVSPSVQGAVAVHWVNGDRQLLVQISSVTGRIYYQCDSPEGFTYGTDTKENLLQKLSAMFG